ncbi:sugar ABC transporter permease, partial [Staphylococcus arlettae]|uniref:sugar ABC transporter permease n=2 Tax=Staphylococcus TaxID=1279 RepID=UPI000E69B73E
NSALSYQKRQWKWLVVPFICSLLLLLVLMVIFNINNTEDLQQARWFFRLSAFVTFGYVAVAIYLNYKRYVRVYYTGKMFNISPIVEIIINTIVWCILLLILLVIFIFSTPINIESSFITTLYFVIMAGILISVISIIMGLITVLMFKLDTLFYICTAITFFIVPIIFIPTTKPSILMHILMLNPVFYVVEGVAQSVVFGAISLNNVPYHFYFYFVIGILCVLAYALKRKVAHAKYNFRYKVEQNTTKEDVSSNDKVTTSETSTD